MDDKASKVMIFDFDGTIADSFFLVQEGFKEFAHRLGIKNPEDFNLQDLRNFSAGEIINKYKISLWKLWKITPELWKFMENRLENVKPIEGIGQLLKGLSNMNLKMMILTSNSEDNVRNFLKKNNLEYFAVIQSKRGIMGKAADIQRMMKSNRLEKNSTIYVGDEVRDIEAARKAGIKIISVTWGFNTKEALKLAQPDYLVNKPKEILAIMEDY